MDSNHSPEAPDLQSGRRFRPADVPRRTVYCGRRATGIEPVFARTTTGSHFLFGHARTGKPGLEPGYTALETAALPIELLPNAAGGV